MTVGNPLIGPDVGRTGLVALGPVAGLPLATLVVGKLTGADSKVVSAEQMEISRLRAELARVYVERPLADALRAMSNDGYLMTPEGMEIALLESKLSGNVTTQQALCEYMDDWIAAVLTGQEARSSGGGALAAASKERQDVRQDLTQADSDLLSETLNETLLTWICEYNGLAPCLVYRIVKEEDDLKLASETDKNVSEMGFELSEEAVREKYGEGWSKKRAAPTPVKPAGRGHPAPAPAAKGEHPAKGEHH